MRGYEGQDPLEALIREHYRAETWHLRAGPGLWQRLEARLAEPAGRPALAGRPFARRGAKAGRHRALAACAAIVVLAGVAVAVAMGQQPRPPVVALASPTVRATALTRQAPPTPTAVATRGPASPPAPPTPAFTATAPPTGQAVVVPRLNVGTLEEAQRAVGVTVRLPRYLPEGAQREDEGARYYLHEGRGMVSLAYRVGSRSLALEYHRLPPGEVLRRDGQPATVGGHPALVHTQPREPSDPLPPISQVVWRDGETTVRVTGDLGVTELLKVAQSMY